MNFKNLLQNKIFKIGFIIELLFLSLIFIEYPLRNIFNDDFLPPLTGWIRIYIFVIFNCILALYYLFYKINNQNELTLKNNFKLIIFFFILFQLTLLIIPPLGSSDIYNYIYRTKVLTTYHQNPYLVPPATFSNDPLFNLTTEKAHNTPLIYGPLWLAISTIPTTLAMNNIYLGTLLFKFTAIIFNTLTLFLIFKILATIKPEHQYLGTALYTFNPLILFETANNGHNDIVMIFFLTLGIYLWIKNKYYLGLAIITLSVLIKFVTILAIPILILTTLNKKYNLTEKIKFICISSLIIIFILLTGYALSGNNFSIFTGVSGQANASLSTFFSPLPIIISLLIPLIDIAILKNIINIFFLIFYAIISIKIFFNKKETDLIKYLFIIFLGYFIIASTWYMPWYFTWVIPFGIILKQYKITFFITIMGLMSYTLFVYPIFIFFIIILSIFYFTYNKILSILNLKKI